MTDLLKIEEIPPITLELTPYKSERVKTKGINIRITGGLKDYYISYSLTYGHYQHSKQFSDMLSELPDEVSLLILSKINWWLAERLYLKKLQALRSYENENPFIDFWEAIKQPDLKPFYDTYINRKDFIDFSGEEPIRLYPVDEPKRKYTLIKKNKGELKYGNDD